MLISKRRQTTRRVTPDARGALDPIDAAQDGIAGSKDLIASVSDDLDAHSRWLEMHHDADIRHERRLKRREALYRLELRGQHAAHFGKSLAADAYRSTRAGALMLRRGSVRIVFYVHDLSMRSAAWSAPRLRAAARVLGQWNAIAFAWLGGKLSRLPQTLRIAARVLERWVRDLSAWAALQAGLIARATAKTGSAAFAWLATTLKVLARDLGRWVSAAAAWIAAQGKALALRLGTLGTDGAASIEARLPVLRSAAYSGAAVVSGRLALMGESASRLVGQAVAKARQLSGPRKDTISSHAGRASP